MADNKGNILGNSFDEEITKQIYIRQSALASNNRTTQNAYNINTAFLRLGSSVNVMDLSTRSGKILESLGLSGYTGNELSKALVLQGGVLRVDKNTNGGGTSYSSSMNRGIFRGASVLNSGAYGFGGNKFGYRPMPGLESAKITSFNNGSIREAEIRIKCFNLKHKKPITPSLDELKINPQSRSAKLRYAIKISENCEFNEFIKKFKYLTDIENLKFSK